MAEEPKNPVDPDRVGPKDWLRLARAVPSAWDVRKIAVAAAGLVALQLGWWAFDRLDPSPEPPGPTHVLGHASLYGMPFRSAADFAEAIRRPAWNLTRPLRLLVNPLETVFAVSGPGGRTFPALLRLLWALAAMGLAGGAICRLAVVEAETGRRPGLGLALAFAVRHAKSLFAVPTYPVLIALGLGLVSAAFGLVARLAPGLAVPLFVGPVVVGLATALLLAHMVASWPLVHAAVAAESEDAAEAVCRCYGYVHHRPMSLAFAVAASWLLGTLGLAAFEVFVWIVAHLSVWGMGLAFLPARPGAIGGAVEPWVLVVGLACQAWVYAFFWCAATRVYLLLRQDVDGVPGNLTTAGVAGGSAASR